MSWPTLNVALKEDTQYFERGYRLKTAITVNANSSVTLSSSNFQTATDPPEQNIQLYEDYQGIDISRVGNVPTGLVIAGLHPNSTASTSPIIDLYNTTSSTVRLIPYSETSPFQLFIKYVNKKSKIPSEDLPDPL